MYICIYMYVYIYMYIYIYIERETDIYIERKRARKKERKLDRSIYLLASDHAVQILGVTEEDGRLARTDIDAAALAQVHSHRSRPAGRCIGKKVGDWVPSRRARRVYYTTSLEYETDIDAAALAQVHSHRSRPAGRYSKGFALTTVS